MFEASDEQSENGEHFDGTKHVLLEEKAGSLENNAMNEQYVNQFVKILFSNFFGLFSTLINANIIYWQRSEYLMC